MMASQWKDGDLIQDWESSPYLEKLLPIYWVTQKLFSVSGPLMVGILCFCVTESLLLYFTLTYMCLLLWFLASSHLSVSPPLFNL